MNVIPLIDAAADLLVALDKTEASRAVVIAAENLEAALNDVRAVLAAPVSDGGSAFPTGAGITGGITVRQYYAAKALSALLQSASERSAEATAAVALHQADALLKAEGRL